MTPFHAHFRNRKAKVPWEETIITVSADFQCGLPASRFDAGIRLRIAKRSLVIDLESFRVRCYWQRFGASVFWA